MFLIRRFLCLVLALFFVVSATITVLAAEDVEVEADYSKFKSGFGETVRFMSYDQTTTAILALRKDKIDNIEIYSDEELEVIYKQREADTYAFLERHTELSVDGKVLFVSKYSKRIIIRTGRADFEALSADSEVVALTFYPEDVGFSEFGVTGVELYFALEEYLKDERAIDYARPSPMLYRESNGIPLVHYRIKPYIEEPSITRIGNYLFYDKYTYSCYPMGVFAVLNGQLVPCYEAYEEGLIKLSDVALAHSGAEYKINNLGDMDGDGSLTIMDVTTLQRGLAHLIEMPRITVSCKDFNDYDVTDYNNDGSLDILDATAMQMSIAKH